MPLGTCTQINSAAPRLWLLGLVASLCGSVYKACVLEGHQLEEFLSPTSLQNASFRQTLLDLLQDALDCLIPASLIWADAGIDPIVVGAAGTVTSLLGARSVFLSTLHQQHS